MSPRAPGIALLLMLACADLGAESPSWVVHSLPADPGSATTPLLLQADGDAAPEWGLLNGAEATIAEIAPDSPRHKLSIPAGTALFDLRDSDRDGRVELAAVRAGRLEYWPDASAAATSEASLSIEHPGIAAISIGGPRPYPLFLEDKGEDFLSVPIGATPPIWTLDGTALTPASAVLEAPLKVAHFQAWPAAQTGRANPVGEIRIIQRFERDISPGDARPTEAPASGNSGTRRARDAGAAPPEEWPWFALAGESRVLYALAPPDYRDTLIRVDRREAGSPAPNPRRYPGIVIAPGAAGSDFNGDGFNDLLLWRAPRPGASLDALIRAAQDGEWEVALSVHLFNPASGRFDARPIDWIHTKAPIEGVLTGGVRGPFGYLNVEDLDGNGRADLLCSAAGRAFEAWTFSGHRERSAWARVELGEPIREIVLIARVPGYHWLGVARSDRAFQLIALPKR